MDIQSNTIEPTEINGVEYKIIKNLDKEYYKIKDKFLIEIIKELEEELENKTDKTLKK